MSFDFLHSLVTRDGEARKVTIQCKSVVPNGGRLPGYASGEFFGFGTKLWTFALMILLAPAPTSAANLRPETIQTWEEYVKAVSARNEKHLVPGSPFLSSDEIPGQAARLRSGDIIVSPAGPHVPLKIPAALIHDWVGAVFVPNVTLSDVLRVVRDYGRYKEIYYPNVVDSKPTATSEREDRFALLLMNKSVIARTALDSDYQSSYTRLDDQHWYSITETTRSQEIADYGTPSQHSLPENEGKGLMWRLYSIARYEERGGGVYIEIEAIALSRDIPVSLRWLIDPLVRRLSRSSLGTSLQQTGDALRLNTGDVSRTSGRPICASGTNCGAAPSASTAGAIRSLR